MFGFVKQNEQDKEAENDIKFEKSINSNNSEEKGNMKFQPESFLIHIDGKNKLGGEVLLNIKKDELILNSDHKEIPENIIQLKTNQKGIESFSESFESDDATEKFDEQDIEIFTHEENLNQKGTSLLKDKSSESNFNILKSSAEQSPKKDVILNVKK